MSHTSGPASSHGGSSDERSNGTPQTPAQAPPKAPSQSSAKVSVIRPEVVTVQKDHLNLLLAKCHNLETQVQANKNLQLVITDAYSQLEKEKKKATKYQTALIQAENRLTEMVRLQLENTSFEDQLPYLMDTGKLLKSRSPAPPVEPHQESSEGDIDIDPDLVKDGPEASETEVESGFHSGYPTSSTKSMHTSSSQNVHTSTLQSVGSTSDYNSLRKDTMSLQTDGNVVVSLSPEDYEQVIKKERLKSQRYEQRIKQLENLLEAKSERNMDALVTQVQDAQKKIDSLQLAIKHKETLLQNYYQGYMAVTKPKPQVETTAEVEELENSSKDELQQIVRQIRAERERLKEEHAQQLVHQKGLFLKEREKTHQLEAQLKTCQQTITDLRLRPAATGDFPLTLADLREKNKDLEESVQLYKQSNAKTAQEKDRAVAGLTMLSEELKRIKKERAELETQVRQLREKLSDPNSSSNTLQAKLAKSETEREKLRRDLEETHRKMRVEAEKCEQSEKRCSQLQRKYDNLKKHSEEQQGVILRLQGVASQQQQPQQGYTAVSPQQQQQSFHNPARSGTQSDRASSRGGYVGDDEILRCDNCFKEYPIEQVEKYQEHMQRCQDDD